MRFPENRKPLGTTGLMVPRIIYGTSYLGNLYRVLSMEEKLQLIRTWFECTDRPVVIDTAGKYGAGLALEMLERGLSHLGIAPDEVIISNKLGWFRVPLTEPEPTFEPGVWAGLEYDCVQTFGYEGIEKCFRQGNELLGGKYTADLVSVHDPDEYLHGAGSLEERAHRLEEILDSYRALFDLKRAGEVKAVGIGAKDWRVIRELYLRVPFDWIMLANSYTIFRHPPELLEFMDQLKKDRVGVVNSALFHGGFLTGGKTFDYRPVHLSSEEGRIRVSWRDRFYRLCGDHGVSPAEACLHFGMSHPAILSVALNTSKPETMRRNADILNSPISPEFWAALRNEGLMGSHIPEENLSLRNQ